MAVMHTLGGLFFLSPACASFVRMMNGPDPKLLEEMMVYRMPFGKYKDRLISELPVYYLEWFATQGFPPGKLGMMLSTMHVIRTNGLEHLLRPLRKG